MNDIPVTYYNIEILIIHMNKQDQGFTLLEVIISLGLLVMIFGLLPLMTVIQNSNIYSSHTTSMTNIAMTLSEQLAMIDFNLVGSSTYNMCKFPTDGKVYYGTSAGVCVEGPLNQLGYTNLENSSDHVYMYYRQSVVCTNTSNITGGYTGEPCYMNPSNYHYGPVPDSLSCVAANYTNAQKEIKILVMYLDKRGKCKTTGLRSMKTVY